MSIHAPCRAWRVRPCDVAVPDPFTREDLDTPLREIEAAEVHYATAVRAKIRTGDARTDDNDHGVAGFTAHPDRLRRFDEIDLFWITSRYEPGAASRLEEALINTSREGLGTASPHRTAALTAWKTVSSSLRHEAHPRASNANQRSGRDGDGPPKNFLISRRSSSTRISRHRDPVGKHCSTRAMRMSILQTSSLRSPDSTIALASQPGSWLCPRF